MSKCPTEACPEILPVNARKKYCAKCRQNMAYWAPGKKRPNGHTVKASDIIEAISLRTRSLSRLSHIADRKADIIELRRRPRRATR